VYHNDIHFACFSASNTPIYSASPIDVLTLCCVFAFHPTEPPADKKTYLADDFQIWTSSAYDESLYPMGLTVPALRYIIPRFIDALRYARRWRMRRQWIGWGLVAYHIKSIMEKAISGWVPFAMWLNVLQAL
jgi:hypothetical protein